MNSKDQDELDLRRVEDEVAAHLSPYPLTPRNVIQAMFSLFYADWVGGDELAPTCDYEE